MKKKTAFIYDESYFWHNSGDGVLFEPPGKYLQVSGSVESPESKRRFKNLLERSGLMKQLHQISPIEATNEQLTYFHTQEHIQNVKHLSETTGGDSGDSAIVGIGSYEIAKLAVGGAIVGVRSVIENPIIENAYVLTRPPGHHAESNQGFGFCLFNNGVIATRYAQKELGIKKVLVLDWDAHHGNGTEDAFYEDDSVLYISIHQEGLDPIDRGNMEDIGRGKGKGYTINIPLLAASGNAVYEYVFDQIVLPATHQFQPDLIIVLAGQDANMFDPLARMMLSADAYKQMTAQVKKLAEQYCQGRMLCLHEGGYSPEYVPFCSHAIVEELSGITTDVYDPFVYAMEGTSFRQLLPHQKARVDEVRAFHGL
ncbi:MAG: class II histone deacetylase [Streptococcaceae bacterium]|jgi:acetoin utilization deacetylase AcuC-like enzyme|nr:class II histone deacetylase [Streptococcaceae bacterium]